MTALGTFLFVAIVPSVLALWFMRGNVRLWCAISVAALVFATAGLVAILTTLMGPDSARHPASLLLSLLGLAQPLGVPLWTLGFGLFALLAPTRTARPCSSRQSAWNW